MQKENRLSTHWRTSKSWNLSDLIFHCEKIVTLYDDKKAYNSCLHLCFLLASELINDPILILTFQYSNHKSHAVLKTHDYIIDLSVGMILNSKKAIIHKFSFFDEKRYKRYYNEKVETVSAIHISREI